MRTSFPTEDGESVTVPRGSPSISGQLESENERDVKCPNRLRHHSKGKVWATIYNRPDGYRF